MVHPIFNYMFCFDSIRWINFEHIWNISEIFLVNIIYQIYFQGSAIYCIISMFGISDVNKKDTIANSNQMIEVTTPTATPTVIKLSGNTSNNNIGDLVGIYNRHGTRNGAPSYIQYLSQYLSQSQKRVFLGQFIALYYKSL